MKRRLLLFIILPAVLSAHNLQFDAVSIRPVTVDMYKELEKVKTSDTRMKVYDSITPKITPGLVRLPYEVLTSIIDRAFKLPGSKVFAPEWAGKSFWSITANIPNGATEKDVPEMLQNMLASRFGMKYHHETRDAEAATLTVARSGLKASKAQQKEPLKESYTSDRQREEGAHIEFSGTSTDLANYLQEKINTAVVDRTGLTGIYKWSWDFYLMGGSDPVTHEIRDPAPNFVHGMIAWHDEGLQKIGIRLMVGSAKLDSVVIDNLNRTPAPN